METVVESTVKNGESTVPTGVVDSPFILKIAWALAAFLGLVLIVAGVSKGVEPLLFIKQIGEYKILPGPKSQFAAAWGLIAFELALGAALLVGYRLRWSLLAACLLFGIFLVAVGWAWATGAAADCGCFGSWAKRSPAAAFFEDVLMLSTGIASLFLLKRTPFANQRKPWQGSVVSAFAAVGIVLPFFFGMFSDPAQQAAKNAESAFQNVKISGITVDLQRGEHVVALILTDCEHCQASVPTFNSYLENKTLPPFVALCPNEEWKRKFFTQRFQAKFPVGEIPQADFDRIIGPGDTPHVVYLRDGKVVKTWDAHAPSVDELKALKK